jgi:hypothetical protein
MKHLEIPGAHECDARPDGAYVAPIWNAHVQTSWDTVTYPGGQPALRFPRIAPTGQRFAGTGQSDNRAWLWDGAMWSSRPCFACPNACIFLPDGTLKAVATPAETGSQGYRYVDDAGHLVKCDHTMADRARHIWEYTTLGGITVGQGGEGPYGDDPVIALLPDGTARLVSRGRFRSVRFTRAGNDLALAWSRQDRNSAELLWLTVAELQALPAYAPLATPVPTPGTLMPAGTTPSPPASQPSPEGPPSASIPNHLDVVKEARERYADKSGPERAGLICNYVAWTLREEGAGTFYKPSGGNWNQRSMDAIIFKPNGETFDILGDAEGDANPQWVRTKPSGFGDPAKWRAATDPDGLTAPPPPPPPSDDSVKETLIAIRDRLDALLAKL